MFYLVSAVTERSSNLRPSDNLWSHVVNSPVQKTSDTSERGSDGKEKCVDGTSGCVLLKCDKYFRINIVPQYVTPAQLTSF
jgi:hypothetical protein